ncbi:MAG: metal-dependent hydrolase [Caldilineaceae bacterium]|jgi:L-ascorbate metabolism protein UlaG (beta-lactamase superfamily)|nr:metal-dependent hydrolase [Caldilineaceae bacterium]
MTLKITWFGHSTFSIDADDAKIVVDPFLKPHSPVASLTAEQVTADFILVTHGHGDHVADLVALAQHTGAQVICNFEIAEWLGKQGVDKTHGMNTGGAHTFPFGRVKLTIAHHSSVLPDGTYAGNPYGFLINFNDGCDLYIAGDTALTYDMKLIGEVGGVDLAILPIGDYFTMGPDDAVVAAQWVKAKHVIPCHYNTFPPIQVDAAAFARRLAREAGIDCTVLAIDEAVEF